MRPSQVLRQALDLEPDSADLAFNLGWALLAEDDRGRGRSAAPRRAARRMPLDSHARVVLVWALRRPGARRRRSDEWKAVLALAPSYESLRAPDLSRRFERIQRGERPLADDREQPHGRRGGGRPAGQAERLFGGGRRRGARPAS